MDFEAIRNYWEQRAASDSSAQSTTQDYFLREIEARVIVGQLQDIAPAHVLDVGCGDAVTTLRVARDHPSVRFTGIDYSAAMIANGRANQSKAGLANVALAEGDVTKPLTYRDAQVIYTTRCLINLPDWDLQRLALDNIAAALSSGGRYLMIENFVEGQDKFNSVRELFGLPPIAIRSHNVFFERDRLIEYLSRDFELEHEENISSSYYLVSRVIYSKMCQERGETPDYFDDHHRFASALPFAGEFGPVRMMRLRRK